MLEFNIVEAPMRGPVGISGLDMRNLSLGVLCVGAPPNWLLLED